MIALTEGNVMDVDDEYSVEGFVAEIATIDEDPDTTEDNGCVFPGFFQPAHTARSEEDGGPLYRMEVLTSEADALMSSPSKVSDNFLPSANKDDEDLEETLITKTMGAKQTSMEKTKEHSFKKW